MHCYKWLQKSATDFTSTVKQFQKSICFSHWVQKAVKRVGLASTRSQQHQINNPGVLMLQYRLYSQYLNSGMFFYHHDNGIMCPYESITSSTGSSQHDMGVKYAVTQATYIHNIMKVKYSERWFTSWTNNGLRKLLTSIMSSCKLELEE